MSYDFEHGYNAYASGCRCETCRAAKAARMREVRAEARRAAARGEVIGAVEHGTRTAWEEPGCRCIPCGLRQLKRHQDDYARLLQRQRRSA